MIQTARIARRRCLADQTCNPPSAGAWPIRRGCLADQTDQPCGSAPREPVQRKSSAPIEGPGADRDERLPTPQSSLGPAIRDHCIVPCRATGSRRARTEPLRQKITSVSFACFVTLSFVLTMKKLFCDADEPSLTVPATLSNWTVVALRA
jgi:hypothetical protein